MIHESVDFFSGHSYELILGVSTMEIRMCSSSMQNGMLLQNSADVNVHMVLILIEHGVGSDLFLSFYNLKLNT